MKKTIIALMALSGVVTAADEVLWTLSNGDITGGSSMYSRSAIQFTLTDAGDSYTAVPSIESAEFSTQQYLQSITFWTSDRYSSGLKGILMTDDRTILATTISNATNGTANQPMTFDFSAANVILTKGSTYTLAFTTYNNAMAFTPGTTASNNAGDYLKPGIHDAKNEDSTYNTDDLYYWNMGGSKDAFLPAISIVTKTKLESAAVPEPTTATLSLLALAGLAARRRRK